MSHVVLAIALEPTCRHCLNVIIMNKSQSTLLYTYTVSTSVYIMPYWLSQFCFRWCTTSVVERVNYRVCCHGYWTFRPGPLPLLSLSWAHMWTRS